MHAQGDARDPVSPAAARPSMSVGARWTAGHAQAVRASLLASRPIWRVPDVVVMPARRRGLVARPRSTAAHRRSPPDVSARGAASTSSAAGAVGDAVHGRTDRPLDRQRRRRSTSTPTGCADVVAADAASEPGRRGSARRRRGTFTEHGARPRSPRRRTCSRRSRSATAISISSSPASASCSPTTRGSAPVVLLENDGRGRFTNRVLADRIARVADVRAGDLDGDGDLDLAVARLRLRRWRDAVAGEPGRLALREHDPAESLGPDQRGDRRSSTATATSTSSRW